MNQEEFINLNKPKTNTWIFKSRGIRIDFVDRLGTGRDKNKRNTRYVGEEERWVESVCEEIAEIRGHLGTSMKI